MRSKDDEVPRPDRRAARRRPGDSSVDTGHAARTGPEPLPAALLTALAFASGCVDAMSYLALGKVFVANMTGNTVLLGIAVVSGEWTRVGRSGCALAGFCTGVAVAALLLAGRSKKRLWPDAATRVLAGELVLLVALAVSAAIVGDGNGHAYWLIALAGTAMGAQSAAVRTVAISGVNTTYITGMLTKLVADAAQRLTSRSRPSPAPDGDRTQEPSGLLLPAGVWSTYLVAALVSAAATQAWGAQSTWIAVGAVGFVLAVASAARVRLR